MDKFSLLSWEFMFLASSITFIVSTSAVTVAMWADGAMGDFVRLKISEGGKQWNLRQWLIERIHLIYPPLSVGGSIAVISAMSLFWTGGPKLADSVWYMQVPAYIGILFGIASVPTLSFFIIMHGRPRFLIPPSDRSQPTGLELKKKYESAAE